MRLLRGLVRKRLFVTLMISITLFAGLVGRLAYVQLVKGDWLIQRAEDLWSRDIPFEAKRGRILDRNGEVLTYNVSAPSILAIPAQIEDPAETARQLALTLGGDEEKIYRKISQRQLIVRLSPEGRKISEKKAQEIRKLRLKGIIVAEDSKRHYPMDNLAAHILGFTGIDNQGLAGLELVYDERLRGTPGYVSFDANARGEKLPGGQEVFTPAKPGMDLVLTLDKKIQLIIERELDQAVVQYQPENVLAIAVNPKTGEVLGMGSRPTFRRVSTNRPIPKSTTVTSPFGRHMNQGPPLRLLHWRST